MKFLNRKVLAVAIVGIFTISAFSGCIGQEEVERVLRLGYEHEPTFLDPAIFTWTLDHGTISNIYSYLIGFKPGTFEMIPDLCKEIPTIENGLISADGKTIKFELREGVKWHPGIQGTEFEGKDYGEVTSADIKFTIERCLGMHDLEYGEVIYGNLYENVDHVETPDDYTVIIHMKAVDVGLFWTLAPYRNGAIVHKAAVDDYGEDFFKFPIGSGPFVFDHWTENEEVVLLKNEDYYGKEPWLDQIVYIPIEEESVRYAALEAGDLDICSATILPETYDLAKANPDFDVVERIGLGNRGISFNFDWEAPDGSQPLSDVRIRRAIAHATDKQAITEAFTKESVAVGFLNPGYAGSIFTEADFPAEFLYPHDIAKAKDLLDQAGYGEGIDLIFHTANMAPLDVMPPVFKEQWAEAGIRLEIVQEESSAWYERMVIKADFCVGWLPLGARPPESIVILKTIFHSVKPGEPYGLNFAHYNNPEVDDWIDEAAVTIDAATRYDLYEKVQIAIMRDLPVFPCQWLVDWVVIHKKVKGLYIDSFNSHGDWMEEISFEE